MNGKTALELFQNLSDDEVHERILQLEAELAMLRKLLLCLRAGKRPRRTDHNRAQALSA